MLKSKIDSTYFRRKELPHHWTTSGLAQQYIVKWENILGLECVDINVIYLWGITLRLYPTVTRAMWQTVISPLTFTIGQNPLENRDSQIRQTSLTCYTCKILNSQNGWKGAHALSLFFVLDNPNLPSSDIISNLISCVLAQTSPFQLGLYPRVCISMSYIESYIQSNRHTCTHMRNDLYCWNNVPTVLTKEIKANHFLMNPSHWISSVNWHV